MILRSSWIVGCFSRIFRMIWHEEGNNQRWFTPSDEHHSWCHLVFDLVRSRRDILVLLIDLRRNLRGLIEVQLVQTLANVAEIERRLTLLKHFCKKEKEKLQVVNKFERSKEETALLTTYTKWRLAWNWGWNRASLANSPPTWPYCYSWLHRWPHHRQIDGNLPPLSNFVPPTLACYWTRRRVPSDHSLPKLSPRSHPVSLRTFAVAGSPDRVLKLPWSLPRAPNSRWPNPGSSSGHTAQVEAWILYRVPQPPQSPYNTSRQHWRATFAEQISIGTDCSSRRGKEPRRAPYCMGCSSGHTFWSSPQIWWNRLEQATFSSFCRSNLSIFAVIWLAGRLRDTRARPSLFAKCWELGPWNGIDSSFWPPELFCSGFWTLLSRSLKGAVWSMFLAFRSRRTRFAPQFQSCHNCASHKLNKSEVA